MTALLTTGERYATLLKVNRAAIKESGLDEIFQATSGAVKQLIRYDRIGLSLFAPDTGALKLAATEGCEPDSFYRIGRVLDCKESHHGWVFQHKKPLLRRDLRMEMEFPTEQHNVIEGMRSYCAVPLVVRGESLGVMIILSSQRNQYSEVHAEFLQEVADQVVLAVKSLMPCCPKHILTRLICPRCIASGGGIATAARHKTQLSEWGRQGGRGRKKPAGGTKRDILS